MLTPGKWEATVKSHFIDALESTGNWFVGIEFKVGEMDLQGRIWLTGDDPDKKDKRMRMARKSLKAIGFDPDTEDIKLLGENQTKLAGNVCQVTVVEEEYKGETSLKLKWINSPPEPATDDFYEGINKGLRAVKSKKKKKGDKLEEPPF